MKSASVSSVRVYPRVCGGTLAGRGHVGVRVGLSPRVRGNRRIGQRGHGRVRSIPACAGEPASRVSSIMLSRVYPRVCGGTTAGSADEDALAGLSPRVRGNRPTGRRIPVRVGSIPACAGEPALPAVRPARSEVYPRVCGGTARIRGPPGVREGLSPRVRGNHHVPHAELRRDRPIPACAGEPPVQAPLHIVGRVYPRVCGGTRHFNLCVPAHYGLSPRVRGNRHWEIPGHTSAGSIPACAGEPCPTWPGPGTSGVYPRVCGGTDQVTQSGASGLGLSPRVRGNRSCASQTRYWAGSIPACAGEPRRRVPAIPNAAVYPRVCGGTA